MHACSRNETVWDVGAKLPALRLCSSIRWAGRWPAGNREQEQEPVLACESRSGTDVLEL
jgi:hypothetical protein